MYILHWIPVHTYCQVAGGWTRLLRSLSRGGCQSPRVEGQRQGHHRDQGSAKQLSIGQQNREGYSVKVYVFYMYYQDEEFSKI